MKFLAKLLAGSLVAAALLQPTEAGAQERMERFPATIQALQSSPTQLGPSPEAFVAAEEDRTTVGLIAGGLVGLAVGAGAGYLLYQDSTAGCDDGICGWVPPIMVGGATGLVLGGWIGYRIAVGPDR